MAARDRRGGAAPGTGRERPVRRSGSSARWLAEHFADPYVRRAQAEGARSRARFKLEEIDRRERLVRSGLLVLELGAAPGAWSQYVRERLGRTGRLIAVDLLPMDPIPGVQILQADLREQAAWQAIETALAGERADLLLSDMAPNLSGMDVIDAPRTLNLAEMALEVADGALKPGAAALIKVLQGAGFDELLRLARQRFERVRCLKPAASRARSPETYLLASGRRMV